uniref:DNA mismatch repair protein MSH3 n=1 Tax=Salix viminalis TaxID=40686 RepID=A0A6N2NDC5_SALVM
MNRLSRKRYSKKRAISTKTPSTTTTTTMGKQKQQIISRFFAPKSKPTTTSPPPPPSPPQTAPSSSSSPKITATVPFSPSKRKLLSSRLTSTPKRPKLSPHTQKPLLSLHQKFLDKLLEPQIPQTPLPQDTQKFTPLEQQVFDLKQKYPDVLLMIEVGYKFRFFGEDAEIAARVLGIYAHKDHNFMTASVPTFRLNVHVRRLVSEGYKVGVVNQTETAAIKAHGENKSGPFCRGLSSLYTKATLEAAENVGGREEGCGGESNYLCCVVEKGLDCGVEVGVFDVRVGVVAVEISTGDVVYGEFNDGFLRSGLEAFVLSLAPAELLLGDPLSKQTEKLLLAYSGPSSNVRVERVLRDCFSDGGALADVMSLYENMIEDNLGDNEKQTTEAKEQGSYHLAIEGVMKMPDLAVEALALTIRHLKQFGFDRMLCLGASFRPFSSNMEMNLSANTLQQLEVLRNNSDGSESGSLLHIMNLTLTIYGSRLLRHWVTHPLCDRNMISARLDAVSEIAECMGSYKDSQHVSGLDEDDSEVAIVQPHLYYLLSTVLTALGRSPDIERGITRIFHRTATASEFIAVFQAILAAGKRLKRLCIQEGHNYDEVGSKTVKSVLLKRLILAASSSNVVGNAAKLLSTLNKEAAEQGDLTNLIIISDDQFPEVARAREAVQFAKENLDSLIGMYRKQLQRRNLEFMSVSGTTHLIELPLDFKVPLNWVKVNSTKKMIRYHPPEVLTALDQLLLTNEELMIVSRAAWDSFLRGFSIYYAEFRGAVQALATLDCLFSFATLLKNKNYVRPIFVDDSEPPQINICSGRHPVLETILQDNFVPNDTNLHADKEYCQIITGPNMGGKSCYIRQVALIALMAQVGSFVPALSAKLHVLDGIHTRMGASDSIQQGRSTFLEELSEASHILHKCTAQSLVIIDELGRGTSTHDGGAIAYATLYHLLDQKRCMVLFVTHYPKIAEIKTEFPGSVGAYHVSYLTSQKNEGAIESTCDTEDVTYLYKLVPGVSEKSFGFNVAQLAELPSSCIRRATIMAARQEAVLSSRLGKKQLLETLPAHQQEEAQENMLRPDGRIENSEDSTVAYREFFSNLKSAMHENDVARSSQFLEKARSIAREFLTKNKRVCIDLSCWIVQLQNVNKTHCGLVKDKPYIRNLFHRLRALIALNCSLIFVADGSIPAIKLATYRRRLNLGLEVTQDETNLQNACSLRRNMGSEFSCMIKEAKDIGLALGIPCLDSIEEAEAQCALLNSESLCDGCFSSDSDVFLFGARTVYRDICLGENIVVCYEMAEVERKLGFGRNSLITLALILGSDYSPGVHGLGPESACQIVRSIGDSDVLQKFASEGLSFAKKIKTSKKQMCSKKTNSLDSEIHFNGNDNNSERKNECLRVIDAYLKPKCHPADSDAVCRVLSQHPFQRLKLQRKCAHFFEWPPEKTDEYTLPKIAERDLRRLANLRSTSSELGVDPPLQKIPVKCPVSRVVKQRKVQGTECFEVLWEGYDGLQTSIVPSDLLESACPERIAEFEEKTALGRKQNQRKPASKKSENRLAMDKIDLKLQNLLLDIESGSNTACSTSFSSKAAISEDRTTSTAVCLTKQDPHNAGCRAALSADTSQYERVNDQHSDVIGLSESENEMSPEHARKARELRLFIASIRDDIS